MIHYWPDLKALTLPQVTINHPSGNLFLKSYGKMWCWWSPYVDAAVFKCAKDESEMLLAADPDTFLFHPYHAPYNLILVRAGRPDEGWARTRMIQQYRDAAPKRWLKIPECRERPPLTTPRS